MNATAQTTIPEERRFPWEGRRMVAVIGSTGSIGTQTLDVIAQHSDRFVIGALAAFRDAEALFAQARRFHVRRLALGDDSAATRKAAAPLLTWAREVGASVGFGRAAVIDAALAAVEAAEGQGDGGDAPLPIVVNGLVGAAGLAVSHAVLSRSIPLALANKESLVVGGEVLMPLARKATEARGIDCLLPIDSEHGAIYQCLIGEERSAVARLWVTASGGPFRTWAPERIAAATVDDALAHPTWKMGPKITVDSASMMNKGLEVIEAHHLFSMDYDRIAVVIQRESVIHSMVEFVDGSVKAHLGATDMRIPIQYALSHPWRFAAPVAPLDFRTLGALHFEAPDTERFPCLKLARAAGRAGGSAGCVLNGADEVAVSAFLAGEIPFGAIPRCVEAMLEQFPAEPVGDLEALEAMDRRTRTAARLWIEEHRR